MTSSSKVLDRMRTRAKQLSLGFSTYVDYFIRSERFSGPSLYFHRKALALRRQHESVADALQDDALFESVYATLASWGMHRMGSGNTKLVEFEDFRQSIRAHAKAIESLEHQRITNIEMAAVPSVTRALWNIISGLKVSVAEARIVANSKTLHHFLPALVPPIDRTYTFNFFYDRTMLSIAEDEAFREMFTWLVKIGAENADFIRTHIESGWNSSEPKIIDNAIVGYILKHQVGTVAVDT